MDTNTEEDHFILRRTGSEYVGKGGPSEKKKRKYLLKGNLFIPYSIEYNRIYVALFILVYSTQASSAFRAR